MTGATPPSFNDFTFTHQNVLTETLTGFRFLVRMACVCVWYMNSLLIFVSIQMATSLMRGVAQLQRLARFRLTKVLVGQLHKVLPTQLLGIETRATSAVYFSVSARLCQFCCNIKAVSRLPKAVVQLAGTGRRKCALMNCGSLSSTRRRIITQE